jgi:transcriptional regulator with XRE-family HTH domain
VGKISSGIRDIDRLTDSFYVGDNVVWEVDAGTSSDIFVKNFIRQAFRDGEQIIYVGFNRSPQSILKVLGDVSREHFTFLDCFTSGKGKNDQTFLKFYEKNPGSNIIRIESPRNIEQFTRSLNTIEDRFPGAKYVFDSLTGMQDLWENENLTYRFFTYMCPRLYDLETVAYWILEKEAHSQKFKANLRHITQVVLELYKRRERLYIKALKLEGREEREAFKPHLYEIKGEDVSITPAQKEYVTEIGSKLREIRLRVGISQKELAEKVGLTSSFLSQLESNQISPSLSSFLQICSALGVNPSQLLDSEKPKAAPWLIRKDSVMLSPAAGEDGIKVFNVLVHERINARLVVLPPGGVLKGHFFYQKMPELISVVKGNVSVTVEHRTEGLGPGDFVFLKDVFPSEWRNEGGDESELLVLS